MVSAFGRGENLAIALSDKGFNVSVYDLTDAFPFEYRRGAGPFPIPRQTYLPAHEGFFSSTEELPRGLVLWLNEGPLEFAGPLSNFFVENNEAFRAAVQNQASSDFSVDWLRRLVRHLVSPYHHEPWQPDSGSMFPIARELNLVPREREETLMGFDRLQSKNFYHRCQKIHDVQIESARLTEMEVEAGSVIAVRAPQWIWCLSSQETEFLNPNVADALFSRDLRRAEWVWMSMQGRCELGPWSGGFPKYSVAINDIHLPWTYANLFVLEWLDKGRFEVWMKVPAEAARDANKRGTWATEAEGVLSSRLGLGKWKIDSLAFSICPHSLVFPQNMKEWRPPGWKNWDWIAPETIARLDLGARFEREMESYQRLMGWRNDQLKRQGARGDQALHPS
jgi:hypothetical protein